MNGEAWSSSFDLAGLSEAYDLECKAAQGRDGRGVVPDDFWKSYSAMANADGGVILLGVQEKPRGKFQAIGLDAAEQVAIEALLQDLAQTAGGENHAAIDSAVEKLAEGTENFAALRLNRGIQAALTGRRLTDI